MRVRRTHAHIHVCANMHVLTHVEHSTGKISYMLLVAVEDLLNS